MSINRTVGLEDRNGAPVGRDPRQMTADELEQLGHERMSLQKALRLRCLDCCAGSANEVRLCVSVTCPSWPFRMGENPWRAPASEERRENGRRLAASFAATRSSAFSTKEQTSTQEGGGTTLAGTPVVAETTTGMGSKSEGGHDH